MNRDLIFGLPTSDKHNLHTKGIFSISRHPLYLGFILITASSCLFYPNTLNILSFIAIWIIHHFIIIKEEEFLTLKYGNEYVEYKKKVKKYLNI